MKMSRFPGGKEKESHVFIIVYIFSRDFLVENYLLLQRLTVFTKALGRWHMGRERRSIY